MTESLHPRASTPSSRAASALALAAVLLAPPTAAAEPHAGVDAQVYKPAIDGNGLFTVETAELLEKGDFSFQFETSYAETPLELEVPGIGDSAADAALEFTFAGHFIFNFAFADWISVGADIGIFRTHPDAGYGERGRFDTGVEGEIRVPSTGLISLRPLGNIDQSIGGPDGRAGPIDPRLIARFGLYSHQGLSLALLGGVWIPFGDEEMFLGDRNFVFEPKIAADWRPLPQLRISVNAGARFRKRTVLEATTVPGDTDTALAVFDLGSEAIAAGGLVYELLPRVILAAEATLLLPLPASLSWGDCELFDGTDCDQIEDPFMSGGEMLDDRYFGDTDYGDGAGYALGGVSFRATKDSTLVASAGAGITGQRADDFRLMFGIRWQPKPEDEGLLGGRGDDDADAVPNSRDTCPNDPEDKDGFQDDDGCPELDNDGDGVSDASDACPMEAEDRDGFRDDDGCPERDNDDDSVPDVTDRCPMEREDLDDFEDGDGCPDVDNDGDGIPDDIDQCPIQAETVNGIEDTDGCPDQSARTGPIYKPDQGVIDLRGARVDFRGRTANLEADSREVLDRVAGEITSNDLVIRIEVHTALGTRSRNPRVIRRQQARDKRLAEARAGAIVGYLQRRGVPEQLVNRAQAVGLGSERPRQGFAEYDPNQNRVDFIVVRQQQN